MSVKRTTVFVLGFLVTLAGCASPGTLIVRQAGDATPKIGKAPADGIYALFIAGQSQALYEVSLKKDAPLGFDRSDDGVVSWLYAVAGPSRNRLDVTQTYEWRLQPDQSQASEKSKGGN